MGLQEAGYDVTSMALDRHTTHAGDENLLVRFYKSPVQDQQRTAEEGRPIFVERDFIEIMAPGNKDNIVSRVASQMDISRFPEHFRRYQARENQDVLEGTPLAEWPGLNRAQVEEFKFLGVRTIEQLITMSDVNGQKVMGINVIKDRARKYLEAAKVQADANVAEGIQVKFAALEEENAKLRADMQTLMSRLLEQPAPTATVAPAPAAASDLRGPDTPVAPARRRRATAPAPE